MAAQKKQRKIKVQAGKAGKTSGIGKYIPLIILGAIVFFAAQAYLMKKSAEAKVLTFHFLGLQAERGSGEGKTMGSYDMTTDSNGNYFFLDEEQTPYGNTRVQKFNPDAKYMGVFSPKRSSQACSNGRFVSADSKGRVYIREAGGSIVRLKPDMSFDKRWERSMENTLALSINDQDQVVTCDAASNAVVCLDEDGKEVSRVSLKKDTLASTARMVALSDGRYVLMSGDGGKPVIRVVEKDGTLSAKFEVKNLIHNPFNFVGVDPKGRIYISDPNGGSEAQGIVVYDLKGKYLGNAKTSDANMDFVATGGIYVDHRTGVVYVNTVMGINKFSFMEGKAK